MELEYFELRKVANDKQYKVTVILYPVTLEGLHSSTLARNLVIKGCLENIPCPCSFPTSRPSITVREAQVLGNFFVRRGELSHYVDVSEIEALADYLQEILSTIMSEAVKVEKLISAVKDQ